jgi:hypothetical protein
MLWRFAVIGCCAALLAACVPVPVNAPPPPAAPAEPEAAAPEPAAAPPAEPTEGQPLEPVDVRKMTCSTLTSATDDDKAYAASFLLGYRSALIYSHTIEIKRIEAVSRKRLSPIAPPRRTPWPARSSPRRCCGSDRAARRLNRPRTVRIAK